MSFVKHFQLRRTNAETALMPPPPSTHIKFLDSCGKGSVTQEVENFSLGPEKRKEERHLLLTPLLWPQTLVEIDEGQ